ncbi:hypothetical protein AZF37_01705 [endosymbiont 'TC1' of Trimyema compressum]|uniref:nicotinate-nucleotide--dimethylbenzimidazole phosphoribosyltransferase n=1 Tax=endosymbiont 'TC1' of Trimyema compressum TaxID=243899 RepID=UPI0007F0FCE8|nr:nicotinate-nucleotide--dimethylbenzimidazole phosphoribosyltransferase [endosymbiont 'TC1' of Trimyema compressum]AMP20058.1 hypothetical protein AZF37_01705 [endosymbiont 'TC1' of Trimyema compressum]
MISFEKVKKEINSVNYEVGEAMTQQIDGLAKPLGSLGYLEKMAVRISRITGKLDNQLKQKAMIVMCSDNCVFEEGIASTPQELGRMSIE